MLTQRTLHTQGAAYPARQAAVLGHDCPTKNASDKRRAPAEHKRSNGGAPTERRQSNGTEPAEPRQCSRGAREGSRPRPKRKRSTGKSPAGHSRWRSPSPSRHTRARAGAYQALLRLVAATARTSVQGVAGLRVKDVAVRVEVPHVGHDGLWHRRYPATTPVLSSTAAAQQQRRC
jgi:hypothetical protein